MRIPKAIQNLIEALERLPGIGSKTAARLTFYLLHVPEKEREQFGQAVLELSRGTAICECCFNITDVSTSARECLAKGTPRQGNTSEVSRRRNTTSEVEELAGWENWRGEGIAEKVLCDVCRDSNRDQSVICVVEDPLDLMAFEKTGKYRGIYHVLQGVIAPLEHIGPDDLKIEELMARLKQGLAPAEENLRRKTLRVERSKPEGLGNAEVKESAGAARVKEVILATNPSLEGEATAMYIKQLISKQLTVNSLKITRIARGIPTGGDLEYADEVTLTKALEGRQEY